MTSLTYLAIRYYLYDRILAGGVFDRTVFRAAVTLLERWAPQVSDREAREAVSGIVLDIIHDDPGSFWKDPAPAMTGAAA